MKHAYIVINLGIFLPLYQYPNRKTKKLTIMIRLAIKDVRYFHLILKRPF